MSVTFLREKLKKKGQTPSSLNYQTRPVTKLTCDYSIKTLNCKSIFNIFFISNVIIKNKT